MKKMVWMLAMVAGLAACSNNGTMENQADSLKVSLDTSLGKIKDSVKAKGERTLDAVKEKLEDLSEKNDTVTDTAK